MNALRAAAIAILLAGAEAGAQEVASGVSPERVAVDAAFKGADLVIFGAVREAGAGRGLDGADVVVIVRGPGRRLQVRPKRRVAGLWVNGEPLPIGGAPGFVHIASSRAFDAIADEGVRAEWRIGLDTLVFTLGTGAAGAGADMTEIARTILNDRRRKNLYQEAPGAVRIVEGTYFSLNVPLPARAPVGVYDVDTLLIRDGVVEDGHLRRFEVRRTGIERALYRFSKEAPTLYGLCALAVALGAGWAASAVFRRR